MKYNLDSRYVTYQDLYLHFNFRLEERYGFTVTFEEYMEACRAPYENTGISNTKSKKRKIVWLRIKGYRVLAVKNVGRAPCGLVTCLPAEGIHKF